MGFSFWVLTIGTICGDHLQSSLSKLWLTPNKIERSQLARSVQTTFSAWGGGEIKSIIKLPALGWKWNIQTTPIKANQGLEVMFPMSKRPKISSWRLITCIRSCTAWCMLVDIECPHKAWDLIQKKIAAIDQGQGLLLVNLSLHLHTWIRWKGIVEGEARAHLPRT